MIFNKTTNYITKRNQLIQNNVDLLNGVGKRLNINEVTRYSHDDPLRGNRFGALGRSLLKLILSFGRKTVRINPLTGETVPWDIATNFTGDMAEFIKLIRTRIRDAGGQLNASDNRLLETLEKIMEGQPGLQVIVHPSGATLVFDPRTGKYYLPRDQPPYGMDSELDIRTLDDIRDGDFMGIQDMKGRRPFGSGGTSDAGPVPGTQPGLAPGQIIPDIPIPRPDGGGMWYGPRGPQPLGGDDPPTLA
jgi:hypothetical protein